MSGKNAFNKRETFLIEVHIMTLSYQKLCTNVNGMNWIQIELSTGLALRI